MQKPNRILAVDDDAVNLMALTRLLSQYVLCTASTGVEALEQARSFHPDLILLDIMLPDLDGYTICRRIRAESSLRRTKIIMLSGKSMLQERLAGYEAGADDYMAKPFDAEELLAKVRVYLKLKSLEEVEEIKNRTIEVLQHSNRTPLNNIITYAELLLTCGQTLDEATRAEAHRVILGHAWRLHRLLEKGETLAAMKAGQFAFEFERGDVCNLLHDIVEELEGVVGQRGIVIDKDVPLAAEAIFDGGQLRFLIHALLDNAIRFSHAGGTVAVKIEQSDHEWVLTVQDHGEGISRDLLSAIFEPYSNPESPLFNQGDGLSLAIAEQIALAHDGSLHVESQPGQGSQFALRIPLSGPSQPAQSDIAERNTGEED